jgi:aminoglycoside phosphotransferase (APT) family kinase protein
MCSADMTDAVVPPPGPLLGSGRAADVYDIGEGRVLRRYHKPFSSIDYEQRVMRFVAEQGIRVPAVFELGPEHQPDRDIVMERIDGITMLDDFEARPWKLFSHVRLLARIQREINALVAPNWMVTPTTAAASKRRDDSVLHLDLHPMNIMITDDGPVVIDWTNAAGGPAGFDAALTYVEMATFEVDGFAQQMGARVGVEVFKRARGAGEIDAFAVAACDHRLADAGITPGERAAVAALRTKAAARQQS